MLDPFVGLAKDLAVDNLAGLGLEPAALDLLTPLHAGLIVLFQQPKTLADHFAGVVVETAFDFSVDELLELRVSDTFMRTSRFLVRSS